MGLFDRLFGKKEEEIVDHVPSNEIEVEETVDSDTLSSEISEAGQNSEADSIDNGEKITTSQSEEEIVTVDVEENIETSQNFENEESMEPISTLEEVEADELSDESEEEIKDVVVDQAAADFMAKYYSQKAALEKSLADGTFVKPETKQVVEKPEVIEEKIISVQESKEEKYNRSLKKTRTGFSARLNSFLANFRRVDEEFFEELEEMLILSDVGVNVATQLTEDLRYEAKIENTKKSEDLKRLIIEKLVDIYEKDDVYNEQINLQNGLTVMLFIGVNGVGKTTSVGKLAYKYKSQGKKVMLVAADTFRAGAVAQLVEWGRRVDVPVITGPVKADPASVVFDSMEKAVAENVDVLLIDTAGRLQNKENLMAELEKIVRIIKRVVPQAPHETLLALDASTGQNALSQAKEFSKITPLTGIILTKIDGTAKGGVVLAIRQELDIPVKLIGFGEKIDDIGEFNSEDFMQGLLEGII